MIFDPDFIKSVGQDSSSIPDLSVYATKDSQASGEYRVDVVLNNELKETTSILFVEKQNGELSPCLSIEKLSSYGLRLSAFPTLKNDAKDARTQLTYQTLQPISTLIHSNFYYLSLKLRYQALLKDMCRLKSLMKVLMRCWQIINSAAQKILTKNKNITILIYSPG